MKTEIKREVYHAFHNSTQAGRIGYVGASCHGMDHRRYFHEKWARLKLNNYKFGRALRKHPREIWSWIVLESGFENDNQMFLAEKQWIKKLGTRKGYNCTDGGEGFAGIRLKKSTRMKLRMANLGKKFSEETKAKMRLIRRKQIYGPEWSIKMRRVILKGYRNGSRISPTLGKKRSPETREKIRQAQLGRPKSHITRMRMRRTYQRRKRTGELWTPRFIEMVQNNFRKGRAPEARRKAKETNLKNRIEKSTI